MMASKKVNPSSNTKESDSIISITSNTASYEDDNNYDHAIAITNPQKNTMTEFIIKQRNLGPHGAYATAQKLRRNFSVQRVDISENAFQDEGVIYMALVLKTSLSITHLNLSNNLMTAYGFRILLENINVYSLRHLDVSANPIGNNGMESLAKFLDNSDILEFLNLSSINLEEEGAKILGVSISLNSSLKKIDLSWNHIRSQGAAVMAKGFGSNNTIEEIDLSYNGFSNDGSLSMSECLKYNKALRILDLSCNRLTYDSAVHIANALAINRTLIQLNLSNNALTTAGVYKILNSINGEHSKLEYLGLKNVSMLKHVHVLIELIQQKRRFVCDAGPVTGVSSDRSTSAAANGTVVLAGEDDAMMRLAKYLNEKRLRLIDMFRILDKKQMLKMEKDEFIKRLKIFEPRLKNKDIFTIADSLATGNIIEYGNLFNQVDQTKNELIAQESTIIKVRLQTLKKSRIYMKNIENQFNTLLNQVDNTGFRFSKSTMDITIDDWLKEGESEEIQNRRLSNLLPSVNRTTMLRCQELFKAFLKSGQEPDHGAARRSASVNPTTIKRPNASLNSIQNRALSRSDNKLDYTIQESKIAEEPPAKIIETSKETPKNTSRSNKPPMKPVVTPRYMKITNPTQSQTKFTYKPRTSRLPTRITPKAGIINPVNSTTNQTVAMSTSVDSNENSAKNNEIKNIASNIVINVEHENETVDSEHYKNELATTTFPKIIEPTDTIKHEISEEEATNHNEINDINKENGENSQNT